ncbi:CHC2 zinc finger domain-containing protein [Sphingobacterium sp. E70]|uniref:CHC2 zinc finger domain-containing protein n=1 Tax=Sphingobacterium sp. E70 TaxID=2853439 RepID=UPI00359C975D
MIKQEVIDKVLETARIEEVVGDFVDLKKRGTSLIGNCPFHHEKTPSFHVSVSKGIYKCFGCGVGGFPQICDGTGKVLLSRSDSLPG